MKKDVFDEEQMVLKVESPVPGPEHANSWFALHLPKNVDLEAGFDAILWHIEFRRKCMNQGFDNLVELLKKTKDTAKADAEALRLKTPPQEQP